MHDVLLDAYERGGVIDITTTGAKTGRPRRIEINFLALDGRYFITGRPGRKRDWLANLNAASAFVVHVKGGAEVDIPATARVIDDPSERWDVLYRILVDGWGNETAKADHILPRWVEGAPLIEFRVD